MRTEARISLRELTSPYLYLVIMVSKLKVVRQQRCKQLDPRRSKPWPGISGLALSQVSLTTGECQPPGHEAMARFGGAIRGNMDCLRSMNDAVANPGYLPLKPQRKAGFSGVEVYRFSSGWIKWRIPLV